MKNTVRRFLPLGVFFLVLGGFFLCKGFVEQVFVSESVPLKIDYMMAMTLTALEQIKFVESPADQKKSKPVKNLEKFNKEYNVFKKEFIILSEQLRINVMKNNIITSAVTYFTAVISFIAGFGLISHRAYGRRFAFLSIVGFCLVYLLFLWFLYPFCYFAQFTCDRVHSLYLLFNSTDPAYQISYPLTKQWVMQVFLFRYPYIILCHLFVASVCVGVVYYLNRPEVKDQLKQ